MLLKVLFVAGQLICYFSRKRSGRLPFVYVGFVSVLSDVHVRYFFPHAELWMPYWNVYRKYVMCQYGAWPAALVIKSMVLPFGLSLVEEVTLTYFVCFLLGNSPASEFYMPTFRNTLFHLRRQALTCL
jgi:hypothetical protein